MTRFLKGIFASMIHIVDNKSNSDDNGDYYSKNFEKKKISHKQQ